MTKKRPQTRSKKRKSYSASTKLKVISHLGRMLEDYQYPVIEPAAIDPYTGAILPDSVAELKSSSTVDHPAHYNTGQIEVIKAIHDWKLGFNLGNAVKYIARAGKKVPSNAPQSKIQSITVEDLRKAVWYLNNEIDLLQASLASQPVHPYASPLFNRLINEQNAKKKVSTEAQ